jgi:hypothetical protein
MATPTKAAKKGAKSGTTRKSWSPGEKKALRNSMHTLSYDDAVAHHVKKYGRTELAVKNKWFYLSKQPKKATPNSGSKEKTTIGREIASFNLSEVNVSIDGDKLSILYK